ncbi:hypothetical protein [Shewanella chilikensis]|uniref:hypothetical protein n=1 Tax=Shewanella chilikensis TaxID=558541 RepID=UPI00399B880B
MSNRFGFSTPQGDVPVRALSLMHLNVDPNAERFVIFDRRNFELIYAGRCPPSGVIKILQPIDYSTGPYFLVGIVDDDGVYNCKFTDGVQAQVVNANTVDMSQ